MKVKLFSPGGCGYQFFSHFLQQYTSVRLIGYPSHREPIGNYPELDKIIYLYSDPRNSLLTYYRKNLKENSYLYRHIELSNGDVKKIPERITIGNLIKYDTCRFLEENFNLWLNVKHPNILYLKYEYLPDNIEKILDFLELKRIISLKFKKMFKPRKSDYKKLDEKMQIKITEYFKKLIETQSKLDSFYKKKL